jgi:hypothetical protein
MNDGFRREYVDSLCPHCSRHLPRRMSQMEHRTQAAQCLQSLETCPRCQGCEYATIPARLASLICPSCIAGEAPTSKHSVSAQMEQKTRWPNPVRDSDGHHDRGFSVISRWRDAVRSVRYVPLGASQSPVPGQFRLARMIGAPGRNRIGTP